MISLLLSLTDSLPGDSSLVTPGAMLLTAAGLFAAGMREYRITRASDLQGERDRRMAAETREKTTEDTLKSKVEALTEQVQQLEDKLDDVRRVQDEKITGMQRAHDQDIEQRRAREINLSNKNFALRQVLADNGIAIPDGLM